MRVNAVVAGVGMTPFGKHLDRSLKWLAGSLFVAAMVAVSAGLVCFLREVYLATHTTTIDFSRFE